MARERCDTSEESKGDDIRLPTRPLTGLGRLVDARKTLLARVAAYCYSRNFENESKKKRQQGASGGKRQKCARQTRPLTPNLPDTHPARDGEVIPSRRRTGSLAG